MPIYGRAVGSICAGQTRDVGDRFTKRVPPGGGHGEEVSPATGEERQLADSRSFSSGELVTASTGEDRGVSDSLSRTESISIVNT